MKIDFTNVEVYTDISKTTCVVHDIKNEFANAIYTNIPGLSAHALAYKIYNSSGEEEYSERECGLIKQCADCVLTPAFIDAINETLSHK
ncbi:hypothetical protein BFS16_00490 [Hoylesella timonensis]|uniref:Uncharacterized protein n=1 Tax=Hoylesella timonensis TaxID=386414 RepID=A0A2K0XPD8_9BACT|nr:hypothetical protein [Hoylesella timonensis]PNP96396.1 hypothetical protein BFS16_00490 [Hoylesella timonensis]